MSPSSGYQESKFVEGVKESKAQWRSIEPLQSDASSLSDLVDVSAESAQRLLVKFGLGKSSADNKLFSLQASKFESSRSTFTVQELQGERNNNKTVVCEAGRSARQRFG